MTTSSKQPDADAEATARERIDALLDEALMESFPASDSCAIGSGTTIIKQNCRERVPIDAPTQQAEAEKGTRPRDKRTP